MAKTLIIVESPAKIKTLKKFLGPEYRFESSVGHIRDLPEKGFGITIEQDFEPTYEPLPDKKEVIQKLRKAAKECDFVYLCPDPDREGEAIAWHIANLLPSGTPYHRVTFNSITKETVVQALASPREIDMALVNAQQARRLLDRIVGYKISPILNRRIQRGKEKAVSAGRVQSAALKIVVDRERQIEEFRPVEYWNLGALLTPISPSIGSGDLFKANLYSVDGARVEKEAVAGKECHLIPNREAADQLLARMRTSPYTILSVERREKRRNPEPPFITSTLQQEASRHFGFSASRTMSIAQTLYEGIDLGDEGTEGLITYMRTDSVRIVEEAQREAREIILEKYGREYLPTTPKQYATKHTAQDAHEAIRPTHLIHTPERVESYLTRDQFLLYQLIWRRFFASQMNPAIYDTVAATIEASSGILLRAVGSQIKFKGFLVLYEEKVDDEEKEEERLLPPLEEGQKLEVCDLMAEQAFTRPPPRFGEASLVKELEKSGIGRPSTYAAIMNKIQSRDYTVKEGGKLKPTELGKVVVQLLEDNFKLIMNLDFTAHMEDDLELVAERKKEWKEVMRTFWETFSPLLEAATKEGFVPKVLTDIDCPECGAKLQKVWFRSKYFYGCSRYPECTFSAPLEQLSFSKEEYLEGFDWEQPCPKCGGAMKVRHGRYGAFLGCSSYPQCRGIVNIPKKGEEAPEPLIPCPALGCPGQVVARKSRFGKRFYACSTYPECDVIGNDLEQLQVTYGSRPRTPFVKPASPKRGRKAPSKGVHDSGNQRVTTKKKGVKKGSEKEEGVKKERFASELPLSEPLALLLGVKQISRPALMKKIWEYIKERDLQDPSNRRKIRPDSGLAALFGSPDAFDMMKLPSLLNPHLGKNPPPS